MIEEQIVEAIFCRYLDNFANFDPEAILSFYYLPAFLITPNREPISVSSEDMLLVVLQQIMADLKKINFQSNRLDFKQIQLLSQNIAIVSGRTKDYRKSSKLATFGCTYTFYKTLEHWKIIVGIIDTNFQKINYK